MAPTSPACFDSRVAAFPGTRMPGCPILTVSDSGDAGRISRYRCVWVPGDTYFFTVNLLERQRTLLVDHIDTVRASFRIAHAVLPLL